MARKPSKLLIFLTVLMDLVGFGIIIPLLPLFAQDLQASNWQLGLLVATHSLIQFLIGPFFGSLSDRVGRRPILLFTTLGNALAFWLLTQSDTLALLFLARIVSGISGANIATASAYLSDVSSHKDRAGALGLLGAAFGLGFVLGPLLVFAFSEPWGQLLVIGENTPFWVGLWQSFLNLLLGFSQLFDENTPFWIGLGLSLLNFFFVWRLLPESLPKEKRSHPSAFSWNPLQRFAELPKMSKAFQRLLLGYLLIITAFALMTTLFSVFNETRFGFDKRDNGMIFAAIGLVGVIIQGGMLRRIEPRVGARKLIFVGLCLMSLSFFGLSFASAVWMMVVISLCVATGNSFAQPSLNTAASRLADSGNQGLTLGLMASSGSLGRVIGPLLCGVLLDFNSQPSQYGTVALWVAAALMAVALLITRHLPAQADARAS